MEKVDKDIQPQDEATINKVKQMLDERLDAQDESRFTNPDEEQASYDPGKQENERIETERNTLYDPETTTHNSIYAWSMNLPGLAEIEVTETDKSRYLKAALNDMPVILPILLEMGNDEIGNICVEIRTLSNYEMDVVFHAIQADSKDGFIAGQAQMAGRMQQYAAALQIVKFQQQSFRHIEFPEPGDAIKDAEKLREFTNEHIASMQWPRWQVILNALRIFETKTKICNDAALNGNFWNPPGADS